MEVHGKILFLGERFTKNKYNRGGSPNKAYEEPWQNRGGGVFEGEGVIPQSTLCYSKKTPSYSFISKSLNNLSPSVFNMV